MTWSTSTPANRVLTEMASVAIIMSVAKTRPRSCVGHLESAGRSWTSSSSRRRTTWAITTRTRTRPNHGLTATPEVGHPVDDHRHGQPGHQPRPPPQHPPQQQRPDQRARVRGPRTAGRSPSEASPNTTVARIGKMASTPLPNPTADFTVTRDSTRWLAPDEAQRLGDRRAAAGRADRPESRGLHRAADPPDEQGRHRPGRTGRWRSRRTGRRRSLSTPPSDAPTTSIVPQALPASALAAGRSSGSTTLGRAAVAAGE